MVVSQKLPGFAYGSVGCKRCNSYAMMCKRCASAPSGLKRVQVKCNNYKVGFNSRDHDGAGAAVAPNESLVCYSSSAKAEAEYKHYNVPCAVTLAQDVLLQGSEFKRNAINTKLASIFEIVWVDDFGDDDCAAMLDLSEAAVSRGPWRATFHLLASSSLDCKCPWGWKEHCGLEV